MLLRRPDKTDYDIEFRRELDIPNHGMVQPFQCCFGRRIGVVCHFWHSRIPSPFPNPAALGFSPLQAPGNHIYCGIAVKGLGNESAADMDSTWSRVQIPHIPHHVRRPSASVSGVSGLGSAPLRPASPPRPPRTPLLYQEISSADSRNNLRRRALPAVWAGHVTVRSAIFDTRPRARNIVTSASK